MILCQMMVVVVVVVMMVTKATMEMITTDDNLRYTGGIFLLESVRNRIQTGFEFNHFFCIAVCAMQIHVLCSSHQILYSSFFAMQDLSCIAIARFWIANAFCACVIVL